PIAASQILRKAVLGTPRLGCINLHSAPLPRYQGMMPNFWTMVEGEPEAAVTVHYMVEKLDAGDIILQRAVPIRPPDSLHDLMVRSKVVGVEALLEAVDFLNPDACVRTGAIRTLVDALLLTPGAGIAGGGLVDAHGRWEPAAARFGPLRHLLLDTTVGRLPARRRRAPYRVDWVYGTFVAVRRDLFRHLGGFDARYFMYGEDLDLCYRAACQGVRTIHVPQARAMHAGSVSARVRFGAEREAEVVKGEMRFYAARRSARELRLFRLGASCKFGLKTALAA